jgi:myo-inositol-1-phosphate synthase
MKRVQTNTHIEVEYQNRYALYDEVEQVQKPVVVEKKIKTATAVPQLGVMLVGLGGNNGSTFTAGAIANKRGLSWATKNGQQKANFHGSFTQSATTHVGFKHDKDTGKLADVWKPIKELLPMVNPVNFDICGWDISGANLYEAAQRAHVLEPTLIEQLKDDLSAIRPMKAVLNPDFIASNQADRADNVRCGSNQELIAMIRQDIQECKKRNDKVIVLWTANTEMFLLPEINTLADLENRIKTDVPLPASVLYCIACIQEQVTYLNGSP